MKMLNCFLLLPQSHLIGGQLSFEFHGCVNLSWITNMNVHVRLIAVF